jgi:hypothetical protein
VSWNVSPGEAVAMPLNAEVVRRMYGLPFDGETVEPLMSSCDFAHTHPLTSL